MADDLVAELTLRLQNEMSAGLNEIRSEFLGMDGTIQQLNGVLGELTAVLADLKPPAALVDGLTSITGEADAAAAAVATIGAAAEADIAKIGALEAAMKQASGGFSAGATFMAPGSPEYDPNVPAMIPPGYQLPDENESEPEPEPEPGQKKKHGFGFDSGNMLLDFVALGTGYDSFEQYADFQSTLGQAATTENLHGQAYTDEVGRLADMMDNLALRYNSNSADLADAYKFLITTGLKPQEVDALMPSLAEASTAHAIDVTDMEGAVFALADSFKIPADQMGAVLARLGYATKMGHFSAESFGEFLPGIGGALATAGDTGPEVADDAFAAMVTIIKNVSIPSQAATDYTDFIHYVGTQHAERSFLQMSRMMLPQMRDMFAKYDISPTDLYAMQDNAVAEGKDPIQTILDFVHNATAKMTTTDRNAVISDWFTNQEGGDAVRSLMLHWDGYQNDITELGTKNQTSLDEDFQNATSNASSDLRTFDENLQELSRTFGADFGFAARVANYVISPPSLVPGTPESRLTDPDNIHPFHSPPRPIELHIVLPPGVTATPRNVPPGVNVKVNQGRVLGSP